MAQTSRVRTPGCATFFRIQFYAGALLNLQANQANQLSDSALAGNDGSPDCSASQDAQRYTQMVTLTHGAIESLCSDD